MKYLEHALNAVAFARDTIKSHQLAVQSGVCIYYKDERITGLSASDGTICAVVLNTLTCESIDELETHSKIVINHETVMKLQYELKHYIAHCAWDEGKLVSISDIDLVTIDQPCPDYGKRFVFIKQVPSQIRHVNIKMLDKLTRSFRAFTKRKFGEFGRNMQVVPEFQINGQYDPITAKVKRGNDILHVLIMPSIQQG